MSSWSEQHRVFAVESFLQSGGSVVTVLRNFRKHFNLNKHAAIPTRRTINRWVAKLKNSASLVDQKRLTPPKIRTSKKHMIDNVMDNFRQRLQHCVEVGGGHLKNVIFKK